MDQHFNSFFKAVMLFISILALSFLSYFFFTCLPSWTIPFSGALFVAACADIYNVFEKQHLFVSIFISSALLLFFTVLSFFVFEFPGNLEIILCLQTLSSIGYSIHIRKNLI